MIEPKKVQFNIINETAEETSINLFNVNTLLDVPSSASYSSGSEITSSSANLINSVINPLNGDIFAYSDDEDIVQIYDSLGNLIDTLTGIGTIGSGNRNAIIFIPFYNYIIVNTDLGIYIIDTYTFSLISSPILTTFYDSTTPNILVYDELSGILYVSSNNGTGSVFSINFTKLGSLDLINDFEISDSFELAKATIEDLRYGNISNQNYLQVLNAKSNNSLAGKINNSFNYGVGFDSSVKCLAFQSDGKIVIGGDFSSYNGFTSNRIIRLNTDGSIDTSFKIGTGFNGSISLITIQSDNKIFLGGSFSIYNNLSFNNLIRLNSDGSIDGTFGYLGGSMNGVPLFAIIDSNNKILIGGKFTSFIYNGVTFNYILRLNSDGTLDNSFSLGTSFNNYILCGVIQLDGKIVLGGDFTTYNGTSANRIIRLNSNGSIDATFVYGTGFNNSVYCLALQDDNKILAGGSFNTYKTTNTIRGIARLTTIGILDDSFTYSIGAGINGTVNSINIQLDKKIVLAGDFVSFNTLSSKNIIRLTENGFIDYSFVVGIGFSSVVNFVKSFSENEILCIGNFTTYQNTSANRIISLNTNNSNQYYNKIATQIDDEFNANFDGNSSISGFNGESLDVVVTNTDLILVCGNFTTYNLASRNRLVCLNIDGSINESFNYNGTYFNNQVNCIFLQSDGKILVGGVFTTYNGVSANRIVRLNSDGSRDNSFSIGTGFSGSFIYDIEVQNNGAILCVGSFTSYNGTTANNIIRLNSDGSIDVSFIYGTGFNDYPRKISIQSDDKIILGGDFITYNGVNVNRIVRLNTDGTIDGSFVLGTGFNNLVNTILIQSDNKILIGGGFTSYNGISRNRIIRLNSNGTEDTSLIIGTGFNNTIVDVFIDNKNNIICSGDFTTYNSISYNRIVAINQYGSINYNLFNQNNLFNQKVNKTIQNINYNFVCVGQFTTYNGFFTANYIIQLENETENNLINAGKINYSFNAGTGGNNNIQQAIQQTDGKIILGGSFTTYNGTNANGIIRLNIDGTIDNSFNYGTGFGAGFIFIEKIVLQSDGKIILGGSFTTYNGTTARNIIRLNSDGSIDSTFNLATSTSLSIGSFVYGIDIQADGKIILGGNFSTYNGVSTNGIVRLNSDGSRDNTFVIGTGFSSLTQVYVVKIQNDNKVLVGGQFSLYNGTSANGIIRLNTDGSIDSTFVYGSGFAGNVRSIALQTDGKIICVGAISGYNGVNIKNIIRLTTNGSIDTTFYNYGGGAGNDIRVVELQADGKILINPFQYGYQQFSGLIRLNTDGSIDNSFIQNLGIYSKNYSSINCLKILNNNTLLAVGSFDNYQGYSSKNIVNISLESVFLNSKPSSLNAYNGNLFGFDINNKKNIFCYDINDNYYKNNLINFNPISGSIFCFCFNDNTNKLLVAGTSDNLILNNLLEIDTTTFEIEKTYSLYNIFPSSEVNSITNINYLTSVNLIVICSERYISVINATNFSTLFQLDNLTLGITNPIFSTLYSPIDNKLLVNCSSISNSDFYFLDCNDYNVSGLTNISNQTYFGCFCGLNNNFYFPTNGTVYVINSSTESISTTISITGSITSENQPTFSSLNNLIYVGSVLQNKAIISYINPINNTVVYIDTTIGNYFIEIISIVFNSEDNFIYLSGYGQSQQLLKLSCINPLTETPTYSFLNTLNPTYDSTLGYFQGMCTSSINGYTYISSKSQNKISVFNDSNILLTSITILTPYWLLYESSLNVIYVISEQSIRLISCVTNSEIAEILLSDNLAFMVFNTFDNKLYVSGATKLFRVENNLSSFTQYTNPVTLDYKTSRIAFNSSSNLLYINGTLNPTNLLVFNCNTLNFSSTLTSLNQMGVNLNLVYNSNNNYLYSVGSNDNTIEVFDCSTQVVVSITNYSSGYSLYNYNTNYVILTDDNTLVFPQQDNNINFLTYYDCNLNKISYSSPVKANYTNVQANNFSGYINGITYNNLLNSINCFIGQNYNTGEYLYSQCLVTISKSQTIYNDILLSYQKNGLSAGSLNEDFISLGFNAPVVAFVKQNDGKIVVGGTFTTYNNISANRIIRLNFDGTIDNSFITGTGISGGSVAIYSVVIQSDGKILVGGQFTLYNGISVNKIVRINTNGSIDNSFVYSALSVIGVYDIQIQSDGQILICGWTSTFAGFCSRLNTDGSVDATFSGGAVFNSLVRKMIIQPDGKIICAGSFQLFNGGTANRIIRLNSNGSKDTSFVYGTGFNQGLQTIALQTDGKILVSSIATTYNGSSIPAYFVRLNSNGSLDTSFSTIIGTGFSDVSYGIAFGQNNEIYVTGRFQTFNGTNSSGIIKLNSNGTIDTSFNYGNGLTGSNRWGNAILIYDSENIFLGGDFINYNSQYSKNIVKIFTEQQQNTYELIKMNNLSGIYWNQGNSNNSVNYYSSLNSIINKIFYNSLSDYSYCNIQNSSEIKVIDINSSAIVTTIPLDIVGSVNDFAYNYTNNLLAIGTSTNSISPIVSSGSFLVINMNTNIVTQNLETYNNYGVNFLNYNPLENSFSYGGIVNSSYITSFVTSSSYVISGGSVDYNFFVQGLNDNPKIIDQIDLIIPQEYSKNPINLQYKDANGISTLKPFFPNVEIDSFQKATNRSFVNFGKEYIMNINTEIVDFKLPPLSTIIFIITYQEFIKANLLDVEVYDEENKAKYLIKQNFNSGNVSAEKYWGSQSMPENFELSSVGWLSELKQKFEKVELLQQDLPKLENGTTEIRLVYKDLFGFKNEVKKRNISITEPLKKEVKPLKLTTKKEPLKPKIQKSVVSLKNKKQTEVKLSTKKQSVKPKTKKKKWLKVINIESEIENSNIWRKVSNEIL